MIDPDDPEKTIAEFEPYFGIYDVKDKCWAGNEKGPFQWTDKMMAMAGATIMNEAMRSNSRFRARLLDGKPFHYKDEVKYAITPLEALRRLEGHNDGS